MSETNGVAVIEPRAEVARHDPGAAVMTREEIEVVKTMYCKGASDAELRMFLTTCDRTGLSPIMRQIFAVKRREQDSDTNEWRDALSVQVSIDGFRLIADRTKKYRGRRSVEWCGKDGRWTDVWLGSGPPAAARVSVLRSDFAEPLTAVARYDSYVQRKRNGDPNRMWATMPDHMLAKCAEALALRTAFPAELSGLYTDDEFVAEPYVEPSGEMTASGDRPTTTLPAEGDVEQLRTLYKALSDPQRQALKDWWKRNLPAEGAWPGEVVRNLPVELIAVAIEATEAIANGEVPDDVEPDGPDDEPKSAPRPVAVPANDDDGPIDVEVLEEHPGDTGGQTVQSSLVSPASVPRPQGETVATTTHSPAARRSPGRAVGAPKGGHDAFDVLKAAMRERDLRGPDRFAQLSAFFARPVKRLDDLSTVEALTFVDYLDSDDFVDPARTEAQIVEAFGDVESIEVTESIG